jgi:hypothetical protein
MYYSKLFSYFALQIFEDFKALLTWWWCRGHDSSSYSLISEQKIDCLLSLASVFIHFSSFSDLVLVTCKLQGLEPPLEGRVMYSTIIHHGHFVHTCSCFVGEVVKWWRQCYGSCAKLAGILWCWFTSQTNEKDLHLSGRRTLSNRSTQVSCFCENLQSLWNLSHLQPGILLQPEFWSLDLKKKKLKQHARTQLRSWRYRHSRNCVPCSVFLLYEVRL